MSKAFTKETDDAGVIDLPERDISSANHVASMSSDEILSRYHER